MLGWLVEWPVAQLAKYQSARLEASQRAWRRLSSLPSVVASALDTRVGTTPHEVVLQLGTLSLRRYRRETPALYAEPVLLCYALVNRPYILDLRPEKSVVRQYLDRGFDVYLIDWGTPSHADHVLTLDDYVGKLLTQVVDFILTEHHIQGLHLLGYCMGGTLSALFAALHPQQVATLTLLAAPIDFSGRESLLNLWTQRKYFDVDAFIDAYGNCPATFLQSCFLCMKPIQNLFEKNLGFYEQMSDPNFVANYFAMEHWVNDNIPVAGETFRQFVKQLYQENQLVRGVFCLGERRVELEQIRCPLLLLTATNDHLVPPASTTNICSHVHSSDVEAFFPGGRTRGPGGERKSTRQVLAQRSSLACGPLLPFLLRSSFRGTPNGHSN
jgi:polyhydroxyalkanoate synthase